MWKITKLLLRALRRLASIRLKEVIPAAIIVASFADLPITLGSTLIGAGSGSGGRTVDAHFIRSCRQRMRLQPKRAGTDTGVDTGLLPPRGFIATAMDLAMMAAAQRHGELIACLPAECAVLREAQMMGVFGPAAADQSGLFGHEPDVLLVTKAARLGMGQPTLPRAA
jgi:hypothetical protein